MARNRLWVGRWAPFAGSSDVQLKEGLASGPLAGCNPTRARFDHITATVQVQEQSPAQYQWRSRDNRKGRHALVVPADVAGKGHFPRPSSSPPEVLKIIGRMFTTFPWWDVSFLVALFFSVGCAVFIICGFFYWLPIVAPSSEFPRETTTAGGIASFVGGTLFQVGAVLLVVEATNENQTGCFGWELERVFSDTEHDEKSESQSLRYKPNNDCCTHNHCRRTGTLKSPQGSKPDLGRKWEWWPTWHELRTHYFHEIGFLGSFIEFVGATVFWINTILSLPGAYNHLSQGVLWGLYWLTYLVGGVLFIISSVLYLIETQPNWYTPAPHLLGWHVGLWNLVGSVGWTLAASLGYCNLSGCKYQAELTLIWASMAFLVGSLILWYEALDKYPVETDGHKS